MKIEAAVGMNSDGIAKEVQSDALPGEGAKSKRRSKKAQSQQQQTRVSSLHTCLRILFEFSACESYFTSCVTSRGFNSFLNSFLAIKHSSPTTTIILHFFQQPNRIRQPKNSNILVAHCLCRVLCIGCICFSAAIARPFFCYIPSRFCSVPTIFGQVWNSFLRLLSEFPSIHKHTCVNIFMEARYFFKTLQCLCVWPTTQCFPYYYYSPGGPPLLTPSDGTCAYKCAPLAQVKCLVIRIQEIDPESDSSIFLCFYNTKRVC